MESEGLFFFLFERKKKKMAAALHACVLRLARFSSLRRKKKKKKTKTELAACLVLALALSPFLCGTTAHTFYFFFLFDSLCFSLFFFFLFNLCFKDGKVLAVTGNRGSTHTHEDTSSET